MRLERRRQQERERRARETPEERDRRRSLRNQRDRERRRARCAARCASALAQLECVCTCIIKCIRIYRRELAHARPPMSSISLVIIIAEHISERQYKSRSILGIYVCIYVRTYVRSSAQASRPSLRRRRRLDVYARARLQYRLGAYRKLGACETRFIAFEPIRQDRLAGCRSFLDRFSTQGEILHVYVYTCTHAYVEFHVYVYACTHA